MPKTVADMVGEARARIQSLTVEEAAQEIESGAALVVDIREEAERASTGAIAGAVPAPRGLLEFFADPESPYHRDEFRFDRRIVLHCASGGRSALAAATLQDMGYENVAHMDGGVKAWGESGRPLEDA